MKRNVLAGAMLTCASWVLAGAAQAQESSRTGEAQQSQPSSTADEDAPIIVTGTRVNRQGFTAPTPTLVLTPDELRQGGRTDIAAALNDLPQFRPSWTPQSTTFDTAAGSTQLDLRGLGSSRTLILVNGRRPTLTTDTYFNVSFIPFTLIERVDVVTGGASAAYGTGAVAGVVNVILNDKLQGLHLNSQAGISSRGDGAEYLVGASYGGSFANGRGHVLIGGEYVDNEGIYPKTSRPWGGAGRMGDPNGQFTEVWRNDINFANATTGGFISTAGPLFGLEFGSGGSVSPFQFSSFRSGTLMAGGGGVHSTDFQYLTSPFERASVYGRATFDLSSSVTLSANMLYGNSKTNFSFGPDNSRGGSALRIERDNAFLPQSIRQQMVAAGLTSFRLGRVYNDSINQTYKAEYETIQGDIGLQGKLGHGFSWDAYVGYGRTDLSSLIHQRITSRLPEAVDSVIGPNGQPICRSALKGPTSCRPFNPFGSGSPSQEAIDYVTGDATLDQRVSQSIAAATVRGEPLSTWAGPISVAAGVEWRHEEIHGRPDELSLQEVFWIANYTRIDGESTTREAFAETVIPLAKDMSFARLLEFNGAARVSDSNRGGTFVSWKAGLSYEPFDGLRLRATRSRDLRSPNFCDLFCSGSVFFTTVLDPFNGNRQDSILELGGGNPDLKPEAANTWTVGAVFQPTFLPGLSLSVDYYDIDISEAITVVGSQTIVDSCFKGNEALCRLVERDAEGRIEQVNAPTVNLANHVTRGVDVEMAYTTSLRSLSLPGRGTFRGLVNYLDDLILNNVETVQVLDGFFQPFQGVPRWRGSLSASYQDERLGVNVRGRYIGEGKFLNLAPGRTLDDNQVESVTYFDLGLDYLLNPGDQGPVTLYANVTNIFDKNPPAPFTPRYHDLVGRYFTAGVRMKF